jgi:hypothetical protein
MTPAGARGRVAVLLLTSVTAACATSEGDATVSREEVRTTLEAAVSDVGTSTRSSDHQAG